MRAVGSCLAVPCAGCHSPCSPQAEGYAEGDTTLYHRFTLMDFLKAPNPVDFLSKANEVCACPCSCPSPAEGRLGFKSLSLCQITLGDGELENHSSTTEELRQCCRDIRVLGRKELRCWGHWDSHTPQLGLLAVPNSCHPTQGPAELEDEAAAVPGQEAQGAGEGVGYQVGAGSGAVPRLGRGCPQHSSSELLPFGSLSSGEEEEGREEERKEKMEAKAAAAEEAKEEEEVELALAEMKAKELAELKR